jgi:hypothetical protein
LFLIPVTATVGGGRTVNVCVSPVVLDPAEELTGPVLLDRVPVNDATTDTEIAQFVAPLSDPPVKEIVDPPGAAVITLPVPHVPFSPFGLSTVKPAGSVSVNETADSVAVAFGLVIVIDRAVAVESPRPTSVGVKALVIVAGATGVAAAADPAATSAAVAAALAASSAATRRRVRGSTAMLRVMSLKELLPSK